MEQEETIFSPQEEKEIAKKAKKRVAFKVHSVIFLLINLLFWLFWFFIFKGSKYEDLSTSVRNGFLFITLTWGICIITHYLIVYKWNKTLVEKEIKHLKKERERKREEELNKISDNN
jgi:hypothetical protein